MGENRLNHVLKRPVSPFSIHLNRKTIHFSTTFNLPMIWLLLPSLSLKTYMSFPLLTQSKIRLLCQGLQEPGGAMAPPDFGRPAYPISTRKWGSRLSPPNYYLPTRFSDFPTSEAHHSKTSWIDAKILFFDEIRFEMPTSQFIKQVDEVPRI